MRRKKNSVILLFSVLIFLLVPLFSVSVFAVLPKYLPVQGRLTDRSNVNLNGNYDMNFRVFDALTAGNKIVQEDHPQVTVTDGLFSVILGDLNSLFRTDLNFDGNRYVEILVGAEVLAPRIRLASSPSAFNSTRCA